MRLLIKCSKALKSLIKFENTESEYESTRYIFYEEKVGLLSGKTHKKVSNIGLLEKSKTMYCNISAIRNTKQTEKK